MCRSIPQSESSVPPNYKRLKSAMQDGSTTGVLELLTAHKKRAILEASTKMYYWFHIQKIWMRLLLTHSSGRMSFTNMQVHSQCLVELRELGPLWLKSTSFPRGVSLQRVFILLMFSRLLVSWKWQKASLCEEEFICLNHFGTLFHILELNYVVSNSIPGCYAFCNLNAFFFTSNKKQPIGQCDLELGYGLLMQWKKVSCFQVNHLCIVS